MRRFVYLALYIALLSFIFFGLGDRILYRQKLDFLGWLPGILLLAVNPLLAYLTARSFGVETQWSKAVAAVSVLVWGPLFGIYSSHIQDKELALQGKQTIGIVYKKWDTRTGWLLRCHFLVGTKEYSTFSEKDTYDEYKVGDTLHILYSEQTPTDCQIIELK